jgi:cytochrome c peroxidase
MRPVRRLCWLSAPLCLMLLLVAGDTPAQRPVPASDTLVSSAAAPSAIADDEPITPIPQPPPGDPMKLALGEKLFGDRRLSHDGTPTCASCHDLHTNGADDSRRKTSAGGSTERSMVLSVFNAALNFRPNWEGNYWTLEAQAESSLENSKSPATSVEEVLGKINADPKLAQQFRDAYGHGPDWTSLRTVVTLAPYFHYGRASTLEAAVRNMAEAQLDRTVSDEQVAMIVAFLITLTGNFRGAPVVTPP